MFIIKLFYTSNQIKHWTHTVSVYFVNCVNRKLFHTMNLFYRTVVSCIIYCWMLRLCNKKFFLFIVADNCTVHVFVIILNYINPEELQFNNFLLNLLYKLKHICVGVGRTIWDCLKTCSKFFMLQQLCCYSQYIGKLWYT